MMHVSHSELVMRPQIAPTRFHDAFADADKRIYMSATPGDGGEFERAFGRHKITRIPVPANCETQGTGAGSWCSPICSAGSATSRTWAAVLHGVGGLGLLVVDG